MSEFDDMAISAWSEIANVFGDSALWRPEGLPEVGITCDVSTSYVFDQEGAGHNSHVIEFQAPSNGQIPGPEDLFEVTSGPFIGNYKMQSVINNDGYTIAVAVKPIGD